MVAVALLIATATGQFGTAQADIGDIGHEGPSYSGSSGSHPTQEKPESKLWHHDGLWWASMWSNPADAFTVHRLDRSTDSWVDTGTVLETAGNYRQDVLFDGSKLYVASHRYATSSGSAEARLIRLSYNSGTETWSRDGGFPATISNARSETLTIDKDSTGRIWATWTTDGDVWLNHTNCSTTCDDASWGSPFKMDTISGMGNAANTDSDDISSVVAFDGKVGVFWSNQLRNADYFAIHDDGASTSTWSLETALSGTDEADDHINIATDGSNVFVAVKTSHDSSSAPETYLLKRTPSGSWSAAETTDGGDRLTRPIVTYDQLNDELHWFGADVGGGKIYTKSSPASSPSFSSGKGDAVIWDASADDMNDPSSTKQPVDPSTGLVVLATDQVADTYWHHDDPLGGVSGIVAGFTAAPQYGEAPLDVQFTDTSIGSPTAWEWDFGDGSPVSTEQNPLHPYASPGTYTVSLTATNASGSDIEVKTNYVEVIAPLPLEATFTVDPSEGAAPLSVQFTDTSPGTPTTWLWDFGDGSTSTDQNPNHVYNAIGTYDVTLSVTNDNAEADDTTVPGAVVVTNEVTLEPVADSFVRDERPGNNYGDEDYLRLRNASSTYRSLVKFDVQDAGGDPVTATLRMYVDDGSPHAGNVYVVDNGWTELGVTAGNAPIPGAAPDVIGGEAVEGTWYEWDVTSLITGDGTYSFMLITDSGNSAYYSSKEGLNPPQLVITSAATQALSADFSADQTTVEVGEPVDFTDLSTGVPTSWSWTFGDTGTSTQQHPQHAYSTPGTYSVSLTVDDGTGNASETKTDYITVTAPLPLDASFEVDAPSGVAPHVVNFTDTSTGVPTSWSWDFGDGNTSTDQDPQHTYNAPGSYTVSLTVGDGTGTNEEIVPGAVTVGADTTVTAAADAHFRSDRPDRNYGTEDHVRIRQESTQYRGIVRFDVASIPTTVTSATVRMFVNDGSPSAGDLFLVGNGWSETTVDWATQPSLGPTPVATGGSADEGGWHEWDVTNVLSGAAPGSFSFTIVSNSHNSAYFSSREGANPPQLVIEGVSGPPPAPTAAFSGTPVAGSAPLAVQFTDLSANSPTSWSWNFGDGSPSSTAQNPSHTYTASGSYTVTLTATNGSGSDDEVKTDYIVVSDPPPPTAAFSGTPLAGSAPLVVQFTDASTGSPTSWSWDFGDGSPTSSAQNPSHTYTANGSYTVTLTATNAFGSDADVKTDYVVVSDAPPPPAPVADFSALPVAGSAPLVVQFTDASTGSPTSWSWDFGDGSPTSTAQNPSHTYTANGSYTVTLTATNAGGPDPETKTDYIVVSDPPSGPETFTATEDAYVKTDKPDKNYGGDTWLRLRQSSSVYESLVTFDVSGLSGPPSSAVLRLFVTDDSPSAGAVYSVDPAAWTESSVTWNTRPTPLALVAPDQAAPAAGQWVEWDVTTALSGSGLVSFSLTGSSGNSVYFSSLEGANPPQLVVTP